MKDSECRGEIVGPMREYQGRCKDEMKECKGEGREGSCMVGQHRVL